MRLPWWFPSGSVPEIASADVCLTAHRSVPAVRLLRERGFDAVQLSGGMIAWRAARLPEARS